MNRRDLLAKSLHVTGAVVVAGLGAPLILSALSPAFGKRERSEKWRALGRIASFPVRQVVTASVPVGGESASPKEVGVFVWRPSENEFVIYSRSCTDLGCPLTHDRGSGWFFCPCHGGIFDENGERRAGPPKKPMWRYHHRLVKDLIEIDLSSVPPMV